jgi:hypothetical protein
MKTYKKRFNNKKRKMKRNRKILKGGTQELINFYEAKAITQEQIDDTKKKIKLEVLLNICELRRDLNIENAKLEPLEPTDYVYMIEKIDNELKIVEKKKKLDLEVSNTRKRLEEKSTKTAAKTAAKTANTKRNWQKVTKKVIIETGFISILKEEIKTHVGYMSKNWDCYKIILIKFISNTGIFEFENENVKKKIEALQKMPDIDIEAALKPDKYIDTLESLKNILMRKSNSLNRVGKITKKKYHNKKKYRSYTKRNKKNMPKLNKNIPKLNKYKQRGGVVGFFVGVAIFLFVLGIGATVARKYLDKMNSL